jgi:hypothetical protein
MAAPTPPKKQRGLPAIEQAREERAARRYRLTSGVGVVAAGVLVAAGILYKCVNDRDVQAARTDLLDRQQKERDTLGADWFPMRDRIEKQILASANEYKGDYVDPSLAKWDFRSLQGIYLRMRAGDATDVEQIRKLAADARKDAFPGCLLRPREGARPDAGAFPEQPWNLGQAYDATRVLNEAFVTQISEADDLMRLRVLSTQYDDAAKGKIALASRLVKGAEYFLLVLDEDVPEAAQYADGGAVNLAALQLVPHPVRVFLFSTQSDKELLRLRRVGSARFLRVTASPEEFVRMDPRDLEIDEEQQRNVNNCSLALQVKEELPSEPAP